MSGGRGGEGTGGGTASKRFLALFFILFFSSLLSSWQDDDGCRGQEHSDVMDTGSTSSWLGQTFFCFCPSLLLVSFS